MRQPLTANDPDVLWDVEDLVVRKIIRSWSDLTMKQRDYGFPTGLILAGRRRMFRRVEVRAWVQSREDAKTVYRPKRNLQSGARP
jgi:predicted DNA-binding transcriptional regulator AlpA